MKCLMLGAGHTPLERKLSVTDEPVDEWVSLDMNRDAKPDILFNLERIESWNLFRNHLPVENQTFDEIHAYDVIEHYGRQGNYKGFFRGMRELWRILKPNGYLIGVCPRHDHEWAWGDPGHTRIITHGTLSFLTRHVYESLGTSPATDYRRYVKPCWWEIVASKHEMHTFQFVLQKIAWYLE